METDGPGHFEDVGKYAIGIVDKIVEGNEKLEATQLQKKIQMRNERVTW